MILCTCKYIHVLLLNTNKHNIFICTCSFLYNVLAPFYIAWDKSSECSDYESVPGTQAADLHQGKRYGR